MYQVENYCKLGFTAVLSSSVAATILVVTPSAFAQQTTTSPITVQSTGTISGTLVLPFFNPNYNKVITRVDTDEYGAYYRNIGTKKNPQLVQVYQSEYVKVATRADGSLNYHVNFKGIPVTSFDAVIKSPVLSDGEITTFNYDGKIEGAKIKAVVQDEFGVKRAFYTGTLTDPNTGTQYQGTFELAGQGPRYSDRNGGDSPTVFDYKSDQPGLPRSEPYKIKDDSPLVKLFIKVPQGTSIVSSSTGGGTPSTGGGTPSTNGGTPPTGGGTPSTNGGTPSTGGGTPSTGGGTPSTNGGTPSTGGGTPLTAPPTTFTPPSLPISSNPSRPSTPSIPSTPSTPSTSSTPSPSPDVTNVEFSSGNSFVTNSIVENPSNLGTVDCLQDSICDARTTTPQPKQRGPRSRVMMR